MTENIRAKILAEALREINRHGSDFHMDDLARNLRISKRTLYENFSSKQEIIEQAIADFTDKIYAYHQRIVSDPAMTCEAKLIAYFDVPVTTGRSCPCGKHRISWQRCPVLVNACSPAIKKTGSFWNGSSMKLRRQENSSLLISSCSCVSCIAQPMTLSIILMMSNTIPPLVTI